MPRIHVSFVVLLLLSVASSTNAGWWHHHHHAYAPAYYAAPMTYAAPQASPPVVVMQQEAPRDTLRDYLPLVLEILRRKGVDVPVPSLPSAVDSSGLKSDLQSLRTETAAGFENVGSVLRRHGEEIVQLRLDVKETRDLLKTVSDNLTSTGDTSIQKRLANIEGKLPARSLEEIRAIVTSDETLKAVKGTTLSEAQQKALLDALRTNIGAALTK